MDTDRRASRNRVPTAQDIARIIRPDLPWDYKLISSWDDEKADALNKADQILGLLR